MQGLLSFVWKFPCRLPPPFTSRFEFRNLKVLGIFLAFSTFHHPPSSNALSRYEYGVQRNVPLRHYRGICAAPTPPSNLAYLTPRACPSLHRYTARIAIGPGVQDQDASLSRSRFFSRNLKGAGTHSPRATHLILAFFFLPQFLRTFPWWAWAWVSQCHCQYLRHSIAWGLGAPWAQSLAKCISFLLAGVLQIACSDV